MAETEQSKLLVLQGNSFNSDLGEERQQDVNTERSPTVNIEIPENGDSDKQINYKEIYQRLLEQYNISISESNNLYAQEQQLRKTLHDFFRKNNAIIDVLLDYATKEDEYLPENQSFTDKKLQEITTHNTGLKSVLQPLIDKKLLSESYKTEELVPKTVSTGEKLLQLYDSIPSLLQDGVQEEELEANPSNTSSWLRFNYPRIFSDTGDILNTLRPLPNTSAYILLNLLISLPTSSGIGSEADIEQSPDNPKVRKLADLLSLENSDPESVKRHKGTE